MGPLGALLRAKFQISGHYVASVRRESRLKVAVVSISAAGLWLVAFAISRVTFSWLEDFGSELLGVGALRLSDVVFGRLLSLFTLALLGMLVFSNVLVAFSTIYRSREVAFLVQSPITLTSLFLARFAECVSFSSWSTAFLGSPILLAYGLVRGVEPAFYLAAILGYLPFVVIPAAVGALLAMLLVVLFTRLGGRSLIGLGVLAVLLLAWLILPRLDAAQLAGGLSIPALVEAMGTTQSVFLPSFWASEMLLSAGRGDVVTAVFDLGLLVANALFLTWLCTEAAERWFYPGWSALQGTSHRRRPRGRGLLGQLDVVSGFLPEPLRSLLIKDLRLFWRDPAQWSQFVIFFGILLLYVGNMRGESATYDRELWQLMITVLNLMASLLILATLTTRFVFPLVSLEGKRFWILGLAPVTLREVVWQKLVLSVATTSLFTVGLMGLSSWKLGLAGRELLLAIFTVSTATVALSGLAVGLGCLYPSFDEDNPARIVSGLGGTLTFVLSLIYIVAVVLAHAFALHSLRRGATLGPTAVALTMVVGLGAVAFFVPLRLGIAHLEKAEI